MNLCGNTGNRQNMTLDLRGLFCPEPVFRIKLELKKHPVDAEIDVITDDPISESEVQEWAVREGHDVIQIAKKDNGDILFLIKKGH